MVSEDWQRQEGQVYGEGRDGQGTQARDHGSGQACLDVLQRLLNEVLSSPLFFWVIPCTVQGTMWEARLAARNMNALTTVLSLWPPEGASLKKKKRHFAGALTLHSVDPGFDPGTLHGPPNLSRKIREWC